MPAVEARGWGWRYPGRSAWAVRGLDLRIETGERVLLLGASGAGKSTLLAGLAGVLDPRGGGEAEGLLHTHGAPPNRSRGETGLLFQDPEDQLVLARAGDDVAFGLENRCVPRSAIWPRVDEALASVGFAYGRDRSTSALSGGEKQRLALAGVLALRPQLLLLDEPTSNLDSAAAAALRSRVRSLLRADSTLLVVDHHVGEWLELVDRVIALEPGRGVLADGSPERVFGDHRAALADAGIWLPATGAQSGRQVVARSPEAGTGSAGASEALVRAEGVTFRHRDQATPAVERVDAEVRTGDVLAITGDNGSGKSTLALLLGGLLHPSAGRVVATPGLDTSDSPREIARWPAAGLARHIGSVFQNPEHQFLCGRVDEELALGARRAGLEPAEADRRVSGLLERLRLAPLAAANPFTLSGGEQRRLSVATALVTAPSVLILDEPTFGQDQRTQEELLTLLGELRDAGSGICLVSHDPSVVNALADRTLRLERPAAIGSVAA